MTFNDPISLGFGDSITYGDLKRTCDAMRTYGAVCLLPSDTSYSLAALPVRQDTISALGHLSGRPKEPISLAFASERMARKYAVITAIDEKVIEHFCPGPITLVCRMAERPDRAQLATLIQNPYGTVGVRIPNSTVERQISAHLERPITTIAIKSDNGDRVTTLDDAIDLLRSRRQLLEKEPWVIVIGMGIKYSSLSTVVAVQPEVAGPSRLRVFRPGAIEEPDIDAAIRGLGFRDIEDWT